jgi:hypothetical protein
MEVIQLLISCFIRFLYIPARRFICVVFYAAQFLQHKEHRLFFFYVLIVFHYFAATFTLTALLIVVIVNADFCLREISSEPTNIPHQKTAKKDCRTCANRTKGTRVQLTAKRFTANGSTIAWKRLTVRVTSIGV